MQEALVYLYGTEDAESRVITAKRPVRNRSFYSHASIRFPSGLMYICMYACRIGQSNSAGNFYVSDSRFLVVPFQAFLLGREVEECLACA